MTNEKFHLIFRANFQLAFQKLSSQPILKVLLFRDISMFSIQIHLQKYFALETLGIENFPFPERNVSELLPVQTLLQSNFDEK